MLPLFLAANAHSVPDAPQQPYVLENKFGIALAVEPQAGFYSVGYKGQSWFGTGIVSVLAGNHWYRSVEVGFPQQGDDERKLVLTDVATTSGNDRFGTFDTLNLTWSVPEKRVNVVTGFRLYRNAPYLVFTQRFPDGFKDYSSGNWMIPSVAFPQFISELGFGSKYYGLRTDLYSWTSAGMHLHRFAYGLAASLSGTLDLLLLADRDYETVILSPFSHYLVATQQSGSVASRTSSTPSKPALNCGIEGLVQEIPAGFEHEHVMVVGSGIGDTFRQWGQLLLDKAGKKFPSKYAGDTLKYPVYWDDYGSYYREHEFKEQGYNSYEEIILGVAEEARRHGLRIGAYQVQDQDQLRYLEGLFEPREDLFPHGLQWLHEKLGTPLEAYVPWLAPGGPYRTKYAFFTTPEGSVPGKSMGDVFYTLDYWRNTAGKLTSWGAILLQQDYQSVYEGNPVMMAGIDKMDTYFKNMEKALQEKGMLMSYAMTRARNIMQSTENPIVVTLQGSRDHHAYMSEPKPQHRDDDPYVWKHLIFSSAFYNAVGLWTSRDNIQTVADPNPWENMAVANLLGGEIELGHRIGECDFDLVRKTYREGDGLVLKPDRPLVPLDRCYLEGCAAAYAESTRKGQRWFYVLSLPAAGYLASFSVSDLGARGRWVIYNYDTQAASLVDSSTSYNLHSDSKHEYFIVAPVLGNGMAVIGDTAKFVTMADMRIASVETEGDALRIAVISSATTNPVVTGYSRQCPASVEAENKKLEELSSLPRLRTAKAGWFWDSQAKLWYVKLDFAGVPEMATKSFRIQGTSRGT